ncbi:MAG: hypothetical protein R2705_21725 [Ilumatobacteraceae bacterium]
MDAVNTRSRAALSEPPSVARTHPFTVRCPSSRKVRSRSTWAIRAAISESIRQRCASNANSRRSAVLTGDSTSANAAHRGS